MKKLMFSPGGAYAYLDLDEKIFAGQCSVEPYMASGPGGQKRNRTYSAVRITHRATGISAIAEESRSQAENRKRALKRLKKNLALCVRTETVCGSFTIHHVVETFFAPGNQGKMNIKNSLFPVYCAALLDALAAAQGKVSDAAKKLHMSTGKMNRLLARDKDLFAAANNVRTYFHHKPLKIK